MMDERVRDVYKSDFMGRRSRNLMVLVLVALVTVLLVAAALPGAALAMGGGGGGVPQGPNGPGGKAPETIFRANCASCHGEKGAGGTSWIDSSRSAPNIQGCGGMMCSVTNAVRNGFLPHMPAFGKWEINDSELSALSTYVQGLPGSYIAPPTAQYTVEIKDEDPWYYPMQLSINVGETVKFINMGKTYHPVTQIDYLATGGASGTDSGMLGAKGGTAPNGTYYRTFTTAGKYTFLCKIHPYMRGEIYVGQGFTPPTYGVDAPGPVPAVAGVGEVWVNAQFQDWTGKTKDGVIQVINTSNWTISNVIAVGNNAHNTWFSADDSKALTVNWFDNTVQTINANNKSVLNTYIAGATPAHVMSDYNGANWHVTVEGSHYIQSFNQSTMSRSTTPKWVTGAGPHGIWNGAGKLVTANSLDSTFSIYNISNGSESARLAAGLYPLGAGANSTGTRGAAGNCLSANVSVFNMSNNTKLADVPVSGCTVQVPFSPDDRYIVAANSPYVSIIDANSLSVVAQIWTGKGAHGVAFGNKSGGGYYAYVTHKYENYVTVIDMTTLTKAGDVPLTTSTTGKVTLVGSTDTGGNGIAVKPNPAPWQ